MPMGAPEAMQPSVAWRHWCDHTRDLGQHERFAPGASLTTRNRRYVRIAKLLVVVAPTRELPIQDGALTLPRAQRPNPAAHAERCPPDISEDPAWLASSEPRQP